MPRQLPWKVQNSNTPKQATAARPRPKTQPSSSSHSPAPSTTRSTPKPKTENGTPSSTNPRRNLGLARGRSPSTSPPPEPLPEEFMREGIDRDDRYRMVEDEFLSVAHDFTRHIHAAEYQRLKGLAKSQNEETIQNISRPVTGEMTEIAKRRHAALDTAARQRKVLGKRRAGSDDDEEEEEEEEGGKGRRRGAGTSLQGLMDSPRRKAVPLTSLSLGSGVGAAPDGSPSRRRGGQNGDRRDEPTMPPAELSSDEDDDSGLDGGPVDWLPSYPRKPDMDVVRKSEVSTAQKSPTTERVLSRIGGRPATSANHTRTTPQQHIKMRQTTTTEEKNIKTEGDDDDDDIFSRIRSRRAELRRRSGGGTPKSPGIGNVKIEKKSDNQRDSISLDEIPPFI